MSKRKAEADSRAAETPRNALKVLRLNEIHENVTQKQKEKKEISRKEIESGLKIAVQACEANKITKENVWEQNAIELFLKFSRLDQVDYRFAGQCVATAVKIFTLRVDSLYEDVLRISKSLGGPKTSGLSEPSIDNTTTDKSLPNVQQRARKRKRVTTVTNNPTSLNAALVTNPAKDPFFSKLNTFVGETSCCNRMLMNMLPHSTRMPGLVLKSPLWDESDEMPLDNVQRVSPNEPLVPSNVDEIFHNCVIRSSNPEYRIMSEPMDSQQPVAFVDICAIFGDDSDDSMDTDTGVGPFLDTGDDAPKYDEMDGQRSSKNIRTQDTGYCTQPASTVDEFVENQQRFSSITTSNFDINELLEPPQPAGEEFIDDMQPVDEEQFEYSYRPAEMIRNYYLGPSYWIFLGSNQKKSNQKKPKRKTMRKRMEMALEDVRRNDKRVEKFISCIGSPGSNACRERLGVKKKKHILPFHYDISPSIFEVFNHSSLALTDPVIDSMIDVEENFDNFDGDYDEFHRNTKSADLLSSTLMPDAARNVFDEAFENPIYDTTVGPFGTCRTSNSPQPFCNIKNIKELCLNIVMDETKDGGPGVRFRVLYEKLSKMFECNSGPSCAMVFFSVVSTASDNKINLTPDNDINNIDDFLISVT